MITLITGAPGTGKTSALVDMLESLGKDRQIYVHGIPDLLIPHIELEKPEEWMSTVPDGSVIIIDEVQNIWRPAGSGQKIPDHIAALETHRHHGLDFYIMTQGLNLVHANVRALVGRHIHLRDLGILGRHWYEWPECADNCRTSWRAAPIKHRYKLPKRIFSKYKSASLHVKPVRGFPRALPVLIVVVILASWFGWKTYQNVIAKNLIDSPSKTQKSSTVSTGFQSTSNIQQPSITIADERVDFMPRVKGRPWTAPAYDHLRKVVSMPQISSAICINKKCECFDGVYKLEITSEQCETWTIDRPFNPYVPRVSSENASADTRTDQHQTVQPVSSPVTETLSMRSPLPL
jgi:zona occludens toxin